MTQSTVSSPADAEPWTVKRILDWSANFLREKGSPSPRLDAELLLCSVLACRRIDLYVGFDKPLETTERDRYRALLRRRAGHEPVAYILGEKEFFGLTFTVNADVLIPRPETEHLIEAVLADFEDVGDRSLSVLDIGTGSGCIAVTLAKKLTGAVVEAWDVSEPALATARANAERNSVAIDFRLRDMRDLAAWQGEPFDVIVSNPPYIGRQEEGRLPSSVKSYEPQLALYADNGGLEFYQALAQNAARRLGNDGRLYLEIGSEQGVVVADLLRETGWRDVAVNRDLAGHNRLIVARAPGPVS